MGEERSSVPVGICNLIEPLVSVTAPDYPTITDALRTVVAQLLCEAFRQDYEAGTESDFSRRFSALVRGMGRPAVQALAQVIDYGLAPRDMLSEALVWLGDLRDASTQAVRRALLTEALRARDLYLRGGAITGLCLLGDHAALPDLRRALDKEQVPEFREQILIAIGHLESPRHGIPRSPA
jgi:hypothetical protein